MTSKEMRDRRIVIGRSTIFCKLIPAGASKDSIGRDGEYAYFTEMTTTMIYRGK